MKKAIVCTLIACGTFLLSVIGTIIWADKKYGELID